MLRSVTATASTTELQCLYAHSIEEGEERENDILETLSTMQEQFVTIEEQHRKEIGALEGRIALLCKNQEVFQTTISDQKATIEHLIAQLALANEQQVKEVKENKKRLEKMELCNRELRETKIMTQSLKRAVAARDYDRETQLKQASEALKRNQGVLQNQIDELKGKAEASQAEVRGAAKKAGVPVNENAFSLDLQLVKRQNGELQLQIAEMKSQLWTERGAARTKEVELLRKEVELTDKLANSYTEHIQTTNELARSEEEGRRKEAKIAALEKELAKIRGNDD